jgi:hypothetical protein
VGVGVAHPKIAVLVVSQTRLNPIPPPSSTAFSTVTGWRGLTVEQALIATSWGVSTGAAFAEANMSPAEAMTARPGQKSGKLRFISRLLWNMCLGGIAIGVP